MKKKIDLHTLWAVLKKEWRTFFDNPASYIVLVVFLLVWEFLFFRNAFLIGEVSLRSLFQNLPWMFLFLVPALTMNSFSEEQKEGTLELLLTHSMKEKDVVWAKFLSRLSIILLAVLLTLPLAISFSLFGSFDWGAYAVQILASLFLGALFTTIGLFISSLLSNQIASLLLSMAINFVLVVVGSDLVAPVLPLWIAPFLSKISAYTHFESLLKGVIEWRDLLYFLVLSALFLVLTFIPFWRRKYHKKHTVLRTYYAAVSLLTVISLLLVSLNSLIPGRLDLTKNHNYTLSSGTKKIVKNLPDVVRVTLYASKVPTQLQTVLQSTKDMLQDYQSYSGGKLTVAVKDPSSNNDIKTEALQNGVQEMQFNVVSQEQYQLQNGFLGVSIKYADQTEAIPYIQSTSDLEYQLSSLINKMTVKDKPKVGILTGSNVISYQSQYSVFAKEAAKQFTLVDVTVDDKNKEISSDFRTLLIPGLSAKPDDILKSAVNNYLDKGGTVLFLLPGMNVDPQQLQMTANEGLSILPDWGVTVNQNIVYDLRSSMSVNLGNNLVNYPLWLQSTVEKSDLPITARLQNVVLPWVSSLSIDAAKLQEHNLKAVLLLKTTQYSGVTSNSSDLSPYNELPTKNLSTQNLSYAVETNDNKPRMVILPGVNYLDDQFVNNFSDNLGFTLNSISWLVQDDTLSTIKMKADAQDKLIIPQNYQVNVIKFGNLALVVLIPVFIGTYRLIRRRNLRGKTYQTTNAN